MYTNIHVLFRSDLWDRCLLLKTDFLFKALAKKNGTENYTRNSENLLKYNRDIQLGGKAMVGNDTIFCAHTGKWQLASFFIHTGLSVSWLKQILYTHIDHWNKQNAHILCAFHICPLKHASLDMKEQLQAIPQ